MRHVKDCAKRARVCVCCTCLTLVETGELDEHQQSCGKRTYSCTQCNSVYETASALRAHVNLHHQAQQGAG